MNNSLAPLWIGLLLVAALSAGAYFFPQQAATVLGATGTRWPNGVSANTTSPVAGQLRGNNLLLDQTTATSTGAVGCVQTNATSSATNIKLIPSTTGATSTFSGTVYWAYGTCP